MAITWTTNISNENLASKRATITFTREDSEIPAATFNLSFQNTQIETTAQRLALLDTIWNEWQEELTRRVNVAAFITDLEQAANSNLMAREV